jgi:predicted O-methyltransferase YrrM
MEETVKADWNVCELGAGGSTVFLAKRTKFVLSIETNSAWAERVRERLREESLTNVNLIVCGSQAECVAEVQKIRSKSLDFALVDSDPKVTDRRELLKNCLTKVKIGGYILLDNFAAFGTQDSDNFMRTWESTEMPDLQWEGVGSKVYRRLA